MASSVQQNQLARNQGGATGQLFQAHQQNYNEMAAKRKVLQCVSQSLELNMIEMF